MSPDDKSIENLAEIRQGLADGRFEFSRHAFKRAIERNISDLEIRQVSRAAKLIEYYPEDKYSPSCLLLGYSEKGRALHLQVSLVSSERVKIITLYEPDPDRWIDDEKRREP